MINVEKRAYMKYSIIIPMFNSEKYIGKCINSILEQKCKDYELIIVDDGSTDKGVDVISQLLHDSSIAWKVISKDNGGQGLARNIGIKHAKGEYLIFIDSDDYLLSEMLETINKVVELKHPDMLCFNSIMVDEKGKNMGTYNMCGQMEGEVYIEEHPEMLMLPPAIWNKVVSRSFFNKVGCFFSEGIIYEDTVVSRALMVEASYIYFIKDALYCYVQRNQSTMGKSRQKKTNYKINDIVKANESLLVWFSQKGLLQKYYYEIEDIAINTIFFYALDILNMNNKSDTQQDILVDFVKQHYSNCSKNKYLSDKERLKIELLLNRQYSVYYRKFAVKKKMKEIIKGVLAILR